ncbi:histidine kinase [Flammeovirga sp. SubArs3]|uniref:sensor histidine kinase n=1 Tax=Flammeovirga sp. SubArs3 TaxID=2995316 RepID=UPI00248C15D8|nr:histidine kinase [Flammeovirga sp. SubArs3]
MNFIVNKKGSVAVQIIFWILYYLLVVKLFQENNNAKLDATLQAVVMVVTFAGISYLNTLFFIPQLFTKKRYLTYLFVVLLIITLTPFFLLWISKTIHFYSLGQKNLPIRSLGKHRFLRVLIPTIFFVFGSTILRLILDFTRNETRRVQIEKERLLAENKFLRSQMNPHFFLNALNNLNAVIRLSPDKSEQYITTLANMMRYVTYDCKHSRVPLVKEMDYIKNYLYSQEIKDSDLTATFHVTIENPTAQIEPMLLMPFVENLFKHGYFDGSQSASIDIRQQENSIWFHCKNGVKPNPSHNSDPAYSGLGIQNVKERLEASYFNKYQLEITNNTIHFEVKLVVEVDADAEP